MNEALKSAFSFYEKKLQELFNQVADTKKMLNQIAKDLGNPIPYEDEDVESAVGSIRVRPGQFFKKPLAASVRELLKMKDEPMDWKDIVLALREGGFELAKSDDAESSARLTILRNTANFVLIPENYFGLKDWYPKTKKEKKIEQNEEEIEKSSENNIEEQLDS